MSIFGGATIFQYFGMLRKHWKFIEPWVVRLATEKTAFSAPTLIRGGGDFLGYGEPDCSKSKRK